MKNYHKFLYLVIVKLEFIENKPDEKNDKKANGNKRKKERISSNIDLKFNLNDDFIKVFGHKTINERIIKKS